MRVQNHRQYDRTFKEDALSLLRRSDRSINAVASDLGVPPSTLDYWYKADMVKKRKPPVVSGKALPIGDPAAEAADDKIARLEREVAELRKENESLKTDRAILKQPSSRRKASEIRVHPRGEGVVPHRSHVQAVQGHSTGLLRYANRPPSARVEGEAKLCEAIREVFAASGETYGSDGRRLYVSEGHHVHVCDVR